MRIIHLLTCSVMILFVSGAFASDRPAKYPGSKYTGPTEIVHGITVPTIQSLLDPTKKYGLNLKNVDIRQNRLRNGGKMAHADVSVDIINLMQTQDIFNEAMDVTSKITDIQQKMKEQAKILSSNDEKAVKKANKELENLNKLLAKEQDKLGYSKSNKILLKTIRDTKDKILQVLKPFEITIKHLDNLPRKTDAEKELNYKFGKAL